MPILIILLFYINDLVKIKRYYSQTEFVAQQIANILQNISQKRTDKKIKIPDIKYALSSAFLSIYPGTSMFAKGKLSFSHEFMIPMPYVTIHYIKGLAGGKASCKWGYSFFCKTAQTPSNWNNNGAKYSDIGVSNVRWNASANPYTIYPKLKINEGEEKIIIESCFFWNTSHADIDGNRVNTSREAFKLHFVSPYSPVPDSQMYFISDVIFTPKPGLFTETAPS